jgi:hypothetical protein
MQGDRVVLIVFGCLGELLRDLRLGRPEDDPTLAFPFSLGLARHGVFEAFGNDDVADLDRLGGDAPGVGLFIK